MHAFLRNAISSLSPVLQNLHRLANGAGIIFQILRGTLVLRQRGQALRDQFFRHGVNIHQGLSFPLPLVHDTLQ